MRKDLGIQTYRDTFHALRQQQRELDRQMNRLVFATVVTLHPLGRLGVENGLEGELGESCLNITGRSGTVSGEDIAPVTLTVYQQVFLTQLNERIADRGIAVRVVLHGLTDDIGYLVVLAVIDRLHGMQNAALNRLETILNSRYSAFQYHIRSIVQEPILVHAGKMILHSITKSTLACHASVMLFY